MEHFPQTFPWALSCWAVHAQVGPSSKVKGLHLQRPACWFVETLLYSPESEQDIWAKETSFFQHSLHSSPSVYRPANLPWIPSFMRPEPSPPIISQRAHLSNCINYDIWGVTFLWDLEKTLKPWYLPYPEGFHTELAHSILRIPQSSQRTPYWRTLSLAATETLEWDSSHTPETNNILDFWEQKPQLKLP